MKFSGAADSSGPVAFVVTSTNNAKYSVIGHQAGLVRLVNIECLKVDVSFKLVLHPDDELLTAGVFNPNGVNIAIGTSIGNIYLGSIREDAQGRPKIMFCKLDVHQVVLG